MVDLNHELTGPAGAPVLVLGNSLGTTTALWEPQLPVVEREFRVLRYNHRGHGGSPAPPGPYRIDELGADLLALLDRLDLAKVSYGGVSLGGMLGMWLAAHAPERVDRLVLCCTTARFPSADPWLERAATVRSEGMAAIVEPVVSRWFTRAFFAAHPDAVRRFQATLASADPEGYAGCCEALAAMDLRPLLPSITAPTLVVAGADDQATPPEHGAAIAEAIPGATLWVVEGAAHLANVERAEQVTDAITSHLTGGPA